MTFSDNVKRQTIEKANQYWVEILDSGKGELRILFTAPYHTDIIPVFYREMRLGKPETISVKEDERQFAETDFIAVLEAMLDYGRGEMTAVYDKGKTPAVIFKGQPIVRIEEKK